MRNFKLSLILLVVCLQLSCKQNSSSEYSQDENTISSVESGVYEDNTYCADVEYYNPNTGTSATYTLNVEVENNEVTVIQWANGGWLDSSHFTPEELDVDGSCSFTSDKGAEYTIQITGAECSFTDEVEETQEEDY